MSTETEHREPRPIGAMTMAMRAPQMAAPTGARVLRLGVVRSGKIVEERIFRERGPVFVGSAESSHVVIAGLPPRQALFEPSGRGYRLRRIAGLSGRVTLPGGVNELSALGPGPVPLGDGARGKLELGDVTLLFQFVVPPPRQPRPQLPASARGGLWAGVDWLFTAIAVASYMALFGFIVFLESSDWQVAQSMAAAAEEHRYIFSEPEPPEAEPERVQLAENPAEDEAAVADAEHADAPARPPVADSDRSPPGPGPVDSPVASQDDSRARLIAEARSVAQNAMLTFLSDGDGQFANLLDNGAATGSHADVLAQVDGVEAATRPAGTVAMRGGEPGGSGHERELSTLRHIEGATSQQDEGAAGPERRIQPRVTPQAPVDHYDGFFDAQLVAARMRGLQPAFRRCYESALHARPELSGRVTVRFQIQPRGNLSAVQATENTTGDAGLGRCIAGAIGRVRFREGPEGGAATFSYPLIFAPQR